MLRTLLSSRKNPAQTARFFVQVAKEQLLLEGELKPFHTVVLRLPVSDETHIAPALDKVAEVLGNQVSIGSYPVSLCCPLHCLPTHDSHCVSANMSHLSFVGRCSFVVGVGPFHECL